MPHLKLILHYAIFFGVRLTLIKKLKLKYEAKNITNAGLSRQVGSVQFQDSTISLGLRHPQVSTLIINTYQHSNYLLFYD